MIETEGVVLLPLESASTQIMIPSDAPTEGAALVVTERASAEAAVLQSHSGQADEWLLASFSILSSRAAGGMIRPGTHLFTEPQSEEGDIVITGPRYYYDGDLGGGGGTGGGDTTGSGGGGTSGGASSGGGSQATAVEQHEQDCGTEDGAAVQVARHVTGALPAGVSGPENPFTTSSGNDWTTVEFGAVIVQNPDGSFGALNNMIYSNDLSGLIVFPNSSGQPVQGLWHSHDSFGSSQEKLLIDRYPSATDWSSLSVIASQAGAVSNPSLWITGFDGVTREFKLSERGYFESLAENHSRMVNGEGLDGKERTQSCG